MRTILFMTLLVLSLWANQNVATKDDIADIKSSLKILIDKVEHMQTQINDLDKRVYANTIKIEALEKNMNKRFEEIDKRFEDMNQRFEFIANILTALVAGIFGLIGFMMWDRRTLLDKAKHECAIKADKAYVENLAKAIKEILSKDETAREIFRKYGLL